MAMKLGTTTHPKFCRLMRQLSIPRFSAVGVLESLWMMASQFTDDGDLTRFDPVDIAAYVDWPGEPRQLVDALVECGWLDLKGESLIVHDFADHAPYFVTERLRKRVQRTSNRKETAGGAGNVQDCPGTVPDSPGTHAESPSLSDLAKPSQAKPSQANSKKATDVAIPSGSKEQKSQRRKTAVRSYTPEFERFWSAYWNRSKKVAAADAFDCAVEVIVDDGTIVDAIDRTSAIEWLVKRTEQYARDRPETAEGLHATTYLNNQRWSDELKVDRRRSQPEPKLKDRSWQNQ